MRVLRRPLTLRIRLIAALLGFSLVGLTVFAVVSVALLRNSLLQGVDRRLSHFTGQLAHERELSPRLLSPRLPSDVQEAILGPDGTVEVGQQPGQSGGPDLAAVQRHAGSGPFRVRDQAGGSSWQVRVVEFPYDRVGVVAVSLASVDATMRPLLIIEPIVGGIVLAVIGIVATVVVRLGLRPLTRIEQTAEAIAGGDLDRRVADSDPRTETGRLGAALNAMLGRLAAALREREHSEHRLRQFVADAGHELRTPLTSIRGFAEFYRRGGARTPAEVDLLTGRIEAEATRMGVLVEDLLLLARLDQERALDITDVDLLVLAVDAVHDAKAREPDRPVTLTPGNGAVHVLGDEHKLRQVVTNLVTNALMHTPAGTPVRLTVRPHVPPSAEDPSVAGPSVADPSVADPSVGGPSVGDPSGDDPPVARAGAGQLPHGPLGVLEVHDEGPGIPIDQAPQVFDRFHSADPRGSSSRGGSGLGLAITAAILEAHNGRIELLTAPRRGTTFRVLLPLA
ncbi:MAG: HAMP domain-containing protein [Pseudonocardiales bacterium]|nr:HAMP domain-containing protein [Pseudonocardiales bacterium]